MKPLTQLGWACAIALVFGGGGYWIGKLQSSSTKVPGIASTATPGARPDRSTAAVVDFSDLRLTLDAEKNPLARFKLAIGHLEGWVAKNPVDALDWLAGQSASLRRDELVRMALNQFSETDARGAAEWALKNLSGGDLNNSLIAIANNWATENGREAAGWFLKLPATRERDAAVEGMFFTWASNEPAAALDFLDSDSAVGDLSPILRRASLAGWAKSDPQAAVAASLESSRTRNDPAQFANTLANWATSDLGASSDWLLANVPASDQRTSAVGELAVIFAHQSPATGVVWLDKLAGGAERDLAASTLAAEWSGFAPADAAKWAATLNAGVLSAEAVDEISRNFLWKDPAAFQSWQNALPAGAMKELAAQVAASDDLKEEDGNH